MSAKPIVSIALLDSYDDASAVRSAVKAALVPFGGMAAFVKPGQRVLLKPNLVAPAKPELAVTTHPAILKAVIEEAQEAQAGSVSFGDGPGVGTATSVSRLAGLVKVAEETQARLVDFVETKTYENNNNRILKHLDLTDQLAENDVLITIPKLKTHSQMAFTCALKNQYGLIPGMAKAQFHFRFQDRDRMADLIVDINRTASPALAVVDAVIGMEGPGPNSGTPRKIGAVIAGTDLAAVDTVASAIIGLTPEEIPILMAARRAEFGATRLEDIDVRGATVEQLKINDFELIRAPANIMRIIPLPKAALKWLRSQIVPRPFILREKCVKCQRCHDGCPVSPPAISPLAPAGKELNNKTCIRCYCCHEFCPAKAIILKKSLLDRIFHIQALCRGLHRFLGWLVTVIPVNKFLAK